MNLSVSIIEDDASVRKILATWVSRAKNFRCVSQHADAEDAFKKLPGQNPDVVLTDINLP